MAFPKHAPKHRKPREPIWRTRCRYCDGAYPVASMHPGFPAHIEDNNLPFMAEIAVSGLGVVNDGMLLVTYTVPDRDYRVFEMPEIEKYMDFYRATDKIAMLDTRTKLIERKRQRFAFPIKCCPMCGRVFKSRSRTFEVKR